MYSNNIDFEFLSEFGIILIFFAIVLGIVSILLYVFGSLGLMELAKKNKMENSWLAFIPLGSTYLLGKLGFEIYPEEANKKTSLVWVFFGLSAAVFVGLDIGSYISIAVSVFSVLAYHNIYKYMFPDKSVKYTVLSFFFGAIPLYLVKEKIVAKVEPVVTSEVNNKQETNNNQTPPEGILKVKF